MTSLVRTLYSHEPRKNSPTQKKAQMKNVNGKTATRVRRSIAIALKNLEHAWEELPKYRKRKRRINHNPKRSRRPNPTAVIWFNIGRLKQLRRVTIQNALRIDLKKLEQLTQHHETRAKQLCSNGTIPSSKSLAKHTVLSAKADEARPRHPRYRTFTL